jgi:hypothetical protein
MGYINLSVRVSSSFPKTTSTMHAITSLIAIFGAGRQSKSTHTTRINTADAVTGPFVQFTKDTPVAQSPVQETKALEDKEAIAHSLASEEGGRVRRLALPSVLNKWKVRAAKKRLLVLHRAAYLVAYQEENEKARQELWPLMTFHSSEEFDAVFPPPLQYITMAQVEEIELNVWEELLARETRLVNQMTGEGKET